VMGWRRQLTRPSRWSPRVTISVPLSGADQAVFVPASPPLPQVVPPELLELTCLFRVSCQLLQHRQVVFAHRAQRYLAAHAQKSCIQAAAVAGTGRSRGCRSWQRGAR